MPTMRDNAIRVKRVREVKATVRTNRQRLLVGLDVAQAEHVVQARHAHTRIVGPTLTIPNTTRGFTQLWARLQQAQRATGCREVVCGLEPTGTYHQAVATFLESQGAEVVRISSSVADWNRRTQDGTWDKHDRKDAANCADLLEQGKILFSSQPEGPLAELRHLVKCLRRARAELASCKARWRTPLRPALGPMGEPLPNRLRADLPAVLQAWEPAAPGRPAQPKGRLPLGLATACAALGAIEAACPPLAERLPADTLLRTIPGIGPTVGAILLAEIGDIAWFTQFSQLRKLAGLDIVRVQSGPFAGQARISKCGRGLLRWALYQAALGQARTVAGRARLAALKAKRHGDRYAGFKATVELAAKVLRVVGGGVAERDPVRSHAGRGPPAPTALRAVDRHNTVFPGEQAARFMLRGGPMGPPGDTGAPLPLSRARPRPGGSLGQRGDRMAPLRWGARDSPGGGLGGRRQTRRSRYGQQSVSQGGIYLDTEETAGSPYNTSPYNTCNATSPYIRKETISPRRGAGRECASRSGWVPLTLQPPEEVDVVTTMNSPSAPQKPKLLDRVREAIRDRHYSRRTEDAYIGWIKRYIFLHRKWHPSEMAAGDSALRG